MHCRKLLLLCPWALLIAQTLPPQPKTPVVPPPTVAPAEKAPEFPSVPPDRVVISVGDVKITAGEFNQIIDSLPAQFQATARGAGRKQTADNLVRILVLSQEGKRRKLDETPAFKIQSMFQNANLLANRTFETINKETSVNEEEMHKYYEAHKSEYDQLQGSHILIRMQGSPVPARPGKTDLTEAEALAKVQEIRKKLVAGEDFAAVATAESDDTQSAAKGGSLGVFRRNQMVPAFDEVAFKLAPGELSEPVKTQFGYHLIKIASKENWTFDEAKPELERRLKPEAAMKAMQELEKKGNAVLDPEFFNLPKQ
jgi:peptidyl-prolyl cis-trans isomerase C